VTLLLNLYLIFMKVVIFQNFIYQYFYFQFIYYQVFYYKYFDYQDNEHLNINYYPYLMIDIYHYVSMAISNQYVIFALSNLYENISILFNHQLKHYQMIMIFIY